MTDWVMVANPSVSLDVFYQIKIAGEVKDTGKLGHGGRVTPTFPGVMNGPVEVTSCSAAFNVYTGACDSPATSPNLIASQRVLSNGGSAFNEVPGTSAESLSGHYYWTWYDNKSATDWVMVANPSASAAVYYQVKIAGNVKDTGRLAQGGRVTPTYPGVMDGPVEVTSCSAAFNVYTGDCDSPATSPNLIASQRVLLGPSFEEVPGAATLSSDYNWTWYDQHSPGSLNWVLVANPSASDDVYYTVTVAGNIQSSGTIHPGKNVTPTFPSLMGGPVEVQAWTGDPDPTKGTPANVIASQRVLWNGYFNEVLGTTLN